MVGEKRQTLMEVGDPQRIARKNKHYVVPVHPAKRTPAEGGLYPLPAVLGAKQKKLEFSLVVGDDIESARRDGVLEKMLLRMHIRGILPLVIRFNGVTIPGNPGGGYVIHDAPPVVQGKNTLELTLKPNAPKDTRIPVDGVELFIDYKGQTNQK